MKKSILFVAFLATTILAQSQNLSDLYDRVHSSIVVIKTLSTESAGQGDKQKVNTSEGLGSGVLVSFDGTIWTASHVVHSAERVVVKFTDGEVYEADVISTSPMADVALIKISTPFNLGKKHIATIGDSDKVKIGEDIFVIGSPLGIEQTLSKGIVSGRMTQDGLDDDFMPVEFIQTDAAINPGNSGGPMFNMKGEVIGVASSIYSISGGFDGIGFAISSNVAKKLLSEEKGVWTGMESILLPQDLARLLNVPQKTGLLITHVSTKGAAAKIGLLGGYLSSDIGGRKILLGGDIILEIAGVKFIDENSSYEIKQKLKFIEKGGKIVITILRQGEIRSAEFNKM